MESNFVRKIWNNANKKINFYCLFILYLKYMFKSKMLYSVCRFMCSECASTFTDIYSCGEN